MKKYIVFENCDYADEFDVEGFVVMEAKNEKELKKKLLARATENCDNECDCEDECECEDGPFPQEFYFGTNEAIEIESEEEFFSCLSWKEISDEELALLKKFFVREIDPYEGMTKEEIKEEIEAEKQWRAEHPEFNLTEEELAEMKYTETILEYGTRALLG